MTLEKGTILHSYYQNDNETSLEEGIVMKRPSASVKSPYMADIHLVEDCNTILAHTPSLGCNGYVDKTQKVLLFPKFGNPKTKSSHSVEFAYDNGNVVGTNPNISNTIIYNLFKEFKLDFITNYESSNVFKERTKGDSRFDIYIKDNDGVEHYIEIKTAPVKDNTNNCAIFPKGYRKKKTDPFSPRAVKHLEELAKLAQEEKTKCYLIFVVPRNDIDYFTPCKEDPIYCDAFINGVKAGVKIVSFCTTINDTKNSIVFDRMLPIKYSVKLKKNNI